MKTLVMVCGMLAAMSRSGSCQEKGYRDPGMNKIVQVAIVCRDLEACSQRWATVLGMKAPEIATTVPGREAKLMFRGKPSDGRVKLAFFNTGQAVLELLQPLGGKTAWQEHLDRYGESVHHIAFQVQDLEKTIQSLEQQGMPVIHRGRYDSDDGTYAYVDSKDQLGVMVELLHSDKR